MRRSWSRWSWDWQCDPFYAEVNLGNVNLPRIKWYWHDEGKGGLALSYGNGNSDPVLALHVNVYDKPRTQAILDRLFGLE